MLSLESIAYDLYLMVAASTNPPSKALQERPVITHFSNPTNAALQECIPNLIKPEYFREPFAKFGVGHEMGAECSCKITPSKGICTWLAMGFPGTTTLPDNKSRFLANFAKGSRVSESKRCSPVKQRQVQRQQDLVVLFDFQGTHGQDGLIEHDCRTETCIVKKGIVFHQDDLEFVARVDT